ncbi:unnamed protein product [Camellia sinensis]
MIINHLLRSVLRRTLIQTQASSYIKYVAASKSLQEHILGAPLWARWNSAEASVQQDISATELKDDKGFKGHSMLAPFTAGWQTTDLHPLVIEKSEGCYLYDTNGKKYLDSLAGLWCTALGGNEHRLVDAATTQLKTLPFYHSFWNRTTKPSLDLAKELLEIFTASKMAKVFFTNSGSEANDTQRLSWFGIITMHLEGQIRRSLLLDQKLFLGETEEEFSTRLANNLENLILKEGPETIAAFIAEPVMGAGGVILPPATYFEKIQAVVKKYDILFIADEVICAFGRLGTMFGCDKYNIKPDLVSLAKALSSAYMPIGAVLVSPKVSDVIHSQSNELGNFSHGFTYSGHPVACAVALETVKIYKESIEYKYAMWSKNLNHPYIDMLCLIEPMTGWFMIDSDIFLDVVLDGLEFRASMLEQERNIIERVKSLSPKFQDGIKAFSNSPIIGEIRGTGLIIGTEFTDNKSPNESFPPEWGIGAYFGAECEKHGMLVRVSGDNIMMCPPFIITPDQLDERVQELKAQ